MLWKNLRKAYMIVADIVIVNIAYLIAVFLYNGNWLSLVEYRIVSNEFLLISLVYVLVFFVLDLYIKSWRYAGLNEAANLFIACGISVFLLIIRSFIGQMALISLDLHIVAGVLAFIMAGIYRFSFRIFSYCKVCKRRVKNKDIKRVLIIGAGQAGSSIVREMRHETEEGYVPVGFIDDDYMKVGNVLAGVKVLGSRDVIPVMAARYKADVILIAINNLDVANKRDILEICKETKCELKIMPNIISMIGEKVSLSNVRKVNLEDLLGRDPVVLDSKGIDDYIKDKVILVTGAAGSIGSQLCRDILMFSPKELVFLDSSEKGIFDIENEFRGLNSDSVLSFVIANIRDKAKLELVFKEFRPEVVFHAAALKHVPLMEHNPAEAVKTNIIGTRNLALLSDVFGVRRFIQISTDKAVNPTNVMGATKRACELFLQSLNSRSLTEFMAVRFGNVLGSAGSVVPFFMEQIRRGGPVTVTHKDITRFFMTIPEASQLVIQAGVFASGGELFVLDMGEPVKIYDLATDLIWLSGLRPGVDVDIVFSGLRPGEKLYEETLRDDEGLSKTVNEKIFVSRPLCRDFEELNVLIDGFFPLFKTEDREGLLLLLERLVPSYVRFGRLDFNVNEVAGAA